MLGYHHFAKPRKGPHSVSEELAPVGGEDLLHRGLSRRGHAGGRMLFDSERRKSEWLWVKVKPPGIGPQVLVVVSICQGNLFCGYPIFDPQLNSLWNPRIWFLFCSRLIWVWLKIKAAREPQVLALSSFYQGSILGTYF